MSETTFEVRSPDWLGFEEARARILSGARVLDPESVAVADALGRALAEPLVARATLPPWDNSAMDGYAVRADDIAGATPATPVSLPVAGVVHAGEPQGARLEPGQAIRIMTGAPVPPGTDSVVRVEDTDGEAVPGTVNIVRTRDAGRHIRPGGEDMRLGDTVLEPGRSITVGTVGVLAALGEEHVSVHRVPTVAIVPTGDELRSPAEYDDVRSGAGVPESNGPMLAAAVREAAALPLVGRPVRDDADELRERLEASLGADVLVTIGGASMGEADLVKRVLDEMGFEQEFWRVKIRPGSPFAFGWLPREGHPQAVFSLPGNPASAFVTFELFVRPFLMAMSGHHNVLRRSITCVSADRMATPADLGYFLRVEIDEAASPPSARLAGHQGSGLVRSLARAQGLAYVPEGVSAIEPGEPVSVMLLTNSGTPPRTA